MRSRNNSSEKFSMISVIVSVHNFGNEVDSLYQNLKKILKTINDPFEILFIDDGSSDNTYQRLEKIAEKDGRVCVVRMRSMFGEAACLDAGLKYSKGERIIFISSRVRVNHEKIPAIIERLKEADMVVGWRHPRSDGIFNRLISWIFNRLTSIISSVKLHDINSGIVATYRSVLNNISFYGNLYNFIPVLAGQQGYVVVEEKIEQMKGRFRKSRYPKEYLQRMLDMITVFFLSRYSKKPIHFLGFIGSLFIMFGAGIEIYLFFYRILRFGGIAGKPLLLLGALLLVIGIQMVSIGLLGEMLIFTHAGDIREYNIKEVINERKR